MTTTTTKTTAPKMITELNPTRLNVYVLCRMMMVGGKAVSRCPNQIRPTSVPHIRRCFKAGLVVIEGKELVLTAAGLAAQVEFMRPTN